MKKVVILWEKAIEADEDTANNMDLLFLKSNIETIHQLEEKYEDMIQCSDSDNYYKWLFRKIMIQWLKNRYMFRVEKALPLWKKWEETAKWYWLLLFYRMAILVILLLLLPAMYASIERAIILIENGNVLWQWY